MIKNVLFLFVVVSCYITVVSIDKEKFVQKKLTNIYHYYKNFCEKADIEVHVNKWVYDDR